MSRIDSYSDSQANALAEGRKNGRHKPHRGLETLLPWFMTSFRAEVPDRLHSGGVWRDARRRDDAQTYAPVGGSLLGAPRMVDSFRAYVEEDPFGEEVAEYEGHKDPVKHYRTPMRAALAKLAGRGASHEERPFMARALFRTALRDGDWDSAAASLGIIEPVRRLYIEAALWHIWRLYQIEPDARPVKVRAA